MGKQIQMGWVNIYKWDGLIDLDGMGKQIQMKWVNIYKWDG